MLDFLDLVLQVRYGCRIRQEHDFTECGLGFAFQGLYVLLNGLLVLSGERLATLKLFPDRIDEQVYLILVDLNSAYELHNLLVHLVFWHAEVVPLVATVVRRVVFAGFAPAGAAKQRTPALGAEHEFLVWEVRVIHDLFDQVFFGRLPLNFVLTVGLVEGYVFLAAIRPVKQVD